MYFYAWDGNGELLGSWLGTKISATTEIGGYTWHYQSFDINSSDYLFNIIFDQGSGLMQTVDIGPLSEDTYYEISDVSNGKYTVTNVTDEIATGITNIMMQDAQSESTSYYNLQGIQTDSPSHKGICLHEGKKVVVK